MPARTVAADSTDPDTLTALAEFASTLPDGQARIAIEAATAILRAGEDVIVAGADNTLTPSQAAKILGVSRAHLYKVLDSGSLPFTIVGARDRRIALGDLRDYIERTELLRRETALRRAHPRGSRVAAIDQM